MRRELEWKLKNSSNSIAFVPCLVPSLAGFIEKVGRIMLQQSNSKGHYFDDFLVAFLPIFFSLFLFHFLQQHVRVGKRGFKIYLYSRRKKGAGLFFFGLEVIFLLCIFGRFGVFVNPSLLIHIIYSLSVGYLKSAVSIIWIIFKL